MLIKGRGIIIPSMPLSSLAPQRLWAHHIPPHDSIKQQQELFQKTRYSRIPVFDGEIDKIIGVAMSKVRSVLFLSTAVAPAPPALYHPIHCSHTPH